MKVTIEERPLEKLENEIVEYIINTPNNANPNVVRTMVSAAAENVSLGSNGKPVYFRIEGNESEGEVFYVSTNQKPSNEELIISLLKNKAIFLLPLYSGAGNEEGILLNDKQYNMCSVTCFTISSADQLYVKSGVDMYVKIFGDGIGTQAREIAADYFASL